MQYFAKRNYAFMLRALHTQTVKWQGLDLTYALNTHCLSKAN